jgi:hypothetical protein
MCHNSRNPLFVDEEGNMSVHFFRCLTVVAALVCAFSVTPAFAQNVQEQGWLAQFWERQRERDRPRRAVPELDKTSAAGAGVLLTGGVLVILGRRRRARK